MGREEFQAEERTKTLRIPLSLLLSEIEWKGEGK